MIVVVVVVVVVCCCCCVELVRWFYVALPLFLRIGVVRVKAPSGCCGGRHTGVVAEEGTQKVVGERRRCCWSKRAIVVVVGPQICRGRCGCCG